MPESYTRKKLTEVEDSAPRFGFSEPQEAWEAIGQNRRVELEVNLFPVVFRRWCVQALRKQVRQEAQREQQ